MSELKEIGIRWEENGELHFSHVYLKSEADKVIAELKDKMRWRKFPDEKPKWGEEVIVVDDASKLYIVRFSYDMK